MDSQYALTGLQLLYADTDTIKNYCRTNKVARDICNSVDFWLEKFDNDNIPIFNLNIKTGNDYMREYIKVTEAQEKVVAIINSITYKPEILRSINIFMDMDHPNYLKMFPIKYQYSILEQKNLIKEPTNAWITVHFTGNENQWWIKMRVKGAITDIYDFLT